MYTIHILYSSFYLKSKMLKKFNEVNLKKNNPDLY